MKEIYISATVLLMLKVPDDATITEIEEKVITNISEVADINVINDLEWSVADEPEISGSISL